MAGQYEKLPSDDSDDWHTIIDESEKDETVKSSAGNDNNNNSNNIGRIPGNVQVNQGRTNNRNAGASAANSRNMQYESNPPGAGHWEENPDSRKRKVKQNKFMVFLCDTRIGKCVFFGSLALLFGLWIWGLVIMDANTKQCIRDSGDGDPYGKCPGHTALPLVRVAQPVIQTSLVPTTVYINMATTTVNIPTTVMTTMSTIVTTAIPTTITTTMSTTLYQTPTPATTDTIPVAPTSSSHSDCPHGCPTRTDKLTPPENLLPYIISMGILILPFLALLLAALISLGKLRQEAAQLESSQPPSYSAQPDGIDVEQGYCTQGKFGLAGVSNTEENSEAKQSIDMPLSSATDNKQVAVNAKRKAAINRETEDVKFVLVVLFFLVATLAMGVITMTTGHVRQWREWNNSQK